MHILTEYADGITAHKKYTFSSQKARLSERRKEDRRKVIWEVPIDERSGLDRRMGQERRRLLRRPSAVIRVT